MLARLLQARGELGAVPGVPGVAGFDGFAIGMEQAEIEVEAIGPVPAECAVRTGEATADRAGGVDAYQVDAVGGLADVFQHPRQFGQRPRLLIVALPGVVVEQQVRVLRQQRQGFAQLPQAIGEALTVQFGLAGQGNAEVGMPAAVDQFKVEAGLLHLPGLAYLGVVEAHELGGFRRIAEVKLFLVGDGLFEPLHQCLEIIHQASPPNTSTLLNTQAGDAWPTRITWLGSPLPQFGVPNTLKVLASPTALSLRQNCAEMAR